MLIWCWEFRNWKENGVTRWFFVWCGDNGEGKNGFIRKKVGTVLCNSRWFLSV